MGFVNLPLHTDKRIRGLLMYFENTAKEQRRGKLIASCMVYQQNTLGPGCLRMKYSNAETRGVMNLLRRGGKKAQRGIAVALWNATYAKRNA